MDMEYTLTPITKGSFIKPASGPETQLYYEITTYHLSPGAVSSFAFCAEDTPEGRAAAHEQNIVAEERLLEHLGLPFPGNQEGVMVHIIRSPDMMDFLTVAVVRQLTQTIGKDEF